MRQQLLTVLCDYRELYSSNCGEESAAQRAAAAAVPPAALAAAWFAGGQNEGRSVGAGTQHRRLVTGNSRVAAG